MTTKATEKKKTLQHYEDKSQYTMEEEDRISNHMPRPIYAIISKLHKKHKNRLIFIER